MEPVACSADVSPSDLDSLLSLMADYREALSEECGSDSDVNGMLDNVCNSLSSYLADVLQPITTAFRYEEMLSRQLLLM